MHSNSLKEIKLIALEKRKTLLIEEFMAINGQLEMEINSAYQVRLKEQLKRCESEVHLIEKEIQDINSLKSSLTEFISSEARIASSVLSVPKNNRFELDSFEKQYALFRTSEGDEKLEHFQGLISNGNFYQLYYLFRNNNSPWKERTFDQIKKISDFDQLYIVFTDQGDPWDRYAFASMLDCSDFYKLYFLFRNHSDPWDRLAFNRLLSIANMHHLRKIYQTHSFPWDHEAEEELVRRFGHG
jgi:hypothetical protein